MVNDGVILFLFIIVSIMLETANTVQSFNRGVILYNAFTMK